MGQESRMIHEPYKAIVISCGEGGDAYSVVALVRNQEAYQKLQSLGLLKKSDSGERHVAAILSEAAGGIMGILRVDMFGLLNDGVFGQPAYEEFNAWGRHVGAASFYKGMKISGDVPGTTDVMASRFIAPATEEIKERIRNSLVKGDAISAFDALNASGAVWNMTREQDGSGWVFISVTIPVENGEGQKSFSVGSVMADSTNIDRGVLNLRAVLRRDPSLMPPQIIQNGSRARHPVHRGSHI